ncbi:MAG: DUF3052 domain-containing protein [Myxococcota bacterium]
MAGYSGTPLAKKLGIKEGHRVLLLGAPEDLAGDLAPLPSEVELRDNFRGRRPFDVVLLFSETLARVRTVYPKAAARLTTSGGLWVCWPKKASKIPTDLDDAAVRAYGLASGLVDNKVCAVDETWSALRFVRRVRDR